MCGIFGVYGHPEAANLTYLGLHALQHRGQESAGISVNHLQQLRTWRGMGLVVDVFDEPTLKRLAGRAAIGHVRYSTSGDSELVNAQPLAVRHGRGQLAVAHNGNLVNLAELRRDLEAKGSIFSSNSDSEVLIHLFARSAKTSVSDRVTDVLRQVKGAYSVVFLTEHELIAARDPIGFRPLVLGRVPAVTEGGRPAWVVASETSAFNLIGAETVRMLKPGEVLTIDGDGLQTRSNQPAEQMRFCVFEHVYFARPDSAFGEDTVYASRKALGRQLAREAPVQADVVIPVPDSGTAAALGYADELRLPFEMGLIRSHYVGRTFIEPRQSIRNFGVKLKLAPVREVIAGRRVVVVDDSVVRGTTSRKIVTMLRDAGASEVHLRISSPPTRHPCYYGIDTPSEEELIASNKSVEETRAFVGCDSLAYVSLRGMLECLGAGEQVRFCDACFSGDYPVPFGRPARKPHLPILQP